MTLNQKKVDAFIAALSELMEVPEGDFRGVITQCLIKAEFTEPTGPQVVPVVSPVSGPVATKGHRTGYNLFYSAMNKELKEQGVNEGRQAQIVAKWHALGKEGQAPWNGKALGSGGASVSVPVPTTRALSGYNIFVREKTPELKAQFKGPDLFRELARLWKLVKDDGKEGEWKIKAGGVGV